MLALGRRIGEKIMIGDNIIITIVEIQSGKVRIGIEAPKEIPVHRREVWLRIKTEEGKELS